jgi:RNA binding exosome subunit
MSKLLALSLMMILLLAPAATLVFADDPPSGPEGEGTEGGEGAENGTDVHNVTVGMADYNGTDDPDDGNETVPFDPELFEALLNQTYAAQQSVNVTMMTMGELNSSISPAGLQNYGHGDDAIALALRFMSENKTTAAWNQMRRAMKHYKSAMQKMYKAGPQAFENLEEDPEDVEPPEDDVNTTEMEGAQLQLMTQYQANLQERMRTMRETVENITDQLSEGDADKLWRTLENAERKLERIRARLNGSDVKGAIDEAEEAEDDLEDGLDGLNNTAAGQMLKTVYKLEAKLQKMEQIRARKAEKGKNLLGDDDAINAAKGNLNQWRQNMKGGKFSEDDGSDDGNPGKGNQGKSNKD